jgi:hypothetical protein
VSADFGKVMVVVVVVVVVVTQGDVSDPSTYIPHPVQPRPEIVSIDQRPRGNPINGAASYTTEARGELLNKRNRKRGGGRETVGLDSK